jgi:hypothetical protein
MLQDLEYTSSVTAATVMHCNSRCCLPANSQYNTIQYIFGIETRPGTSQRADSHCSAGNAGVDVMPG